jgi:hypothetical protein
MLDLFGRRIVLPEWSDLFSKRVRSLEHRISCCNYISNEKTVYEICL